jgi:hypothetical protein
MRASFILGLDDLKSPDWPTRWANYSLFVCQPQLEEEHLQKIRRDIPGAKLLAYFDTQFAMIDSGCATSGNASYFKALNRYFKPQMAITDLHTGLPICLQPHRGWAGTQPAGWVAFPNSVDAMAAFHREVTMTVSWDGLYLDDAGSEYDMHFAEIIQDASDRYDIDGDGLSDDLATLVGQWAAFRPYLFNKLREVVGPDRLLIANSGLPHVPDPNLNGITLEAENCHSAGSLEIPRCHNNVCRFTPTWANASTKACLKAFAGQAYISALPRISIYWVTPVAALVSAAQQCSDVSELEKSLPPGSFWEGVDTLHHSVPCLKDTDTAQIKSDDDDTHSESSLDSASCTRQLKLSCPATLFPNSCVYSGPLHIVCDNSSLCFECTGTPDGGRHSVELARAGCEYRQLSDWCSTPSPDTDLRAGFSDVFVQGPGTGSITSYNGAWTPRDVSIFSGPTIVFVPPDAGNPNGTLLAFADAQAAGLPAGGLEAQLTVVMRRSTDVGLTWGNMTTPWRGFEPYQMWVSSSAVFDPVHHKIVLLIGNLTAYGGGPYTYNATTRQYTTNASYHSCEDTSNTTPAFRGPFSIESTDRGTTWGAGPGAQSQFCRWGVCSSFSSVMHRLENEGQTPSRCLAVTDMTGVSLPPSSLSPQGRIIFVLSDEKSVNAGAMARGDLVVRTDDGGVSYQSSPSLFVRGLSEAGLARLANGSVMAVMRHCTIATSGGLRHCIQADENTEQQTASTQQFDPNYRLAFALSSDGGATFGFPRVHPDLVTPMCQAGFASTDAGTLLVSTPYEDTNHDRVNLTVIASDSNGDRFERQLKVWSGEAGYSTIVCGLPGELNCGVIFDRFRPHNDKSGKPISLPFWDVSFVRFSSKWNDDIPQMKSDDGGTNTYRGRGHQAPRPTRPPVVMLDAAPCPHLAAIAAPTMKTDDAASTAHFVTYSSRLPHNGSTGLDGFNWTNKPCFLTGGNAFAAGSMDWMGAHPDRNLTECTVDDPPPHCFTDPQRVKSCLDQMPIGRRAIHLQGGIWLYGKSSKTVRAQCGGWADFDPDLPGGCTLWSDRWEEIVARRMDRWFASYKALGGTVDVIMLDFETNPWWEPGDFYHERADLSHTLADPRWPAVLAQLNERGKQYGVNFNNISDIVEWGSSHFDGDFRKWIWTDVMGARRGAYLNRSMVDPVRKHFPNVAGSDYDHHMHVGPGNRWEGGYLGITTAPVCCGSHVGTHSSGAYYGETALRNGAPTELVWTSPASDDGSIAAMNITAPTTPFNMLISYIRRARGEILATAPMLIPLMPWVQPKNSSWYSKMCHTAPCGSNHSVLASDGAFEEMIFHLGLSGVSEFLWYRAGDEWPTEGIEYFSAVLSELDTVVGRASAPSDAHCLKDLISFDDDFLLSGHPTKAPNVLVFRFSPRNFNATTILSKSAAKFKLSNGSHVVPVPGGSIMELSSSVGTNGYWIILDSETTLKTDDTSTLRHTVAPPAPPPVPYEVLWNSPWPAECADNPPPRGGNDPSKPVDPLPNWTSFGIITNNHSEADYNGETVATLYAHDTGLYPEILGTCGPEGPNTNYNCSVGPDGTPRTMVNGGIPQLLNLTAHLEKWAADIVRILPDPNWGGVANLDWEAWNPDWEVNGFAEYQIYQNRSIELVLSQHPSWTVDEATPVAKEQFEASTKALWLKTLALAKALRPHGKWGWYNFAHCMQGCSMLPLHGDSDLLDAPLGSCKPAATLSADYNTRMMWLYTEVTALFPSIYLPCPPPSHHAASVPGWCTASTPAGKWNASLRNIALVDCQMDAARYTAAAVEAATGVRPEIFAFGWMDCE